MLAMEGTNRWSTGAPDRCRLLLVQTQEASCRKITTVIAWRKERRAHDSHSIHASGSDDGLDFVLLVIKVVLSAHLIQDSTTFSCPYVRLRIKVGQHYSFPVPPLLLCET